MKYFVVENKEQKRDQFLNDITDFLWDNGNEVHISSYYNKADFQQVIQSCDCIILLKYQGACFEEAREAFRNNHALDKSILQKTFLFFSEKGVYTNTIPFPYKIFDFEQLDEIELSQFFSWYRRLGPV